MDRTSRARRSTTRLLALAGVATLAGAGLTAVALPASAAALRAAAPLAAAPVGAAPSGVLSPTNGANQGCASGSGTLSCELYAVAGTNSVAGGAPFQEWVFSPTASPAPSTVQGMTAPTIVVTEGDTLTLNLHNRLTDATGAALPSTAAVSLAVPGLESGPTDTTGAAPGADATYTIDTRGRTGTFLYEAGHTAIGARAAAMGLVGAIVVRPSGGPQTVTGDASSAFDDEAVLLLTDVDPKLAADPLGFDLRDFHSVYRMVNGRSFPDTQAIGTKAGDKVLLRYVNGGTLSHSMGPLGLRQRVVDVDGQSSGGVGDLVADTLPAGGTEDAIVTAVDGSTPVYDTAGALDNAGGAVAGDVGSGVTASGRNRVAFGGMMVMLSTRPAAPSTDVAGPKVTLSVSTSTTVDVRATDLASAWCTSATAGDCGPSGVAEAEYLVDTDPSSVAPGGSATSAISLSSSGSAPATARFTVAAAPGTHRVYVRARDSVGNWGAPVSALVTVPTTPPATDGVTATAGAVTAGATPVSVTASATPGAGDTVAAMEAVAVPPVNGGPDPRVPNPAPGSGTALTVTAPAAPGTAFSGTGTVRLATLFAGDWSIWVRARGGSGQWGAFQKSATVVTRSSTPTVALQGTDGVTPNPVDGVTGDPVDPSSEKVQATFGDGGGNLPIVAAEGVLPNPGTTGPGSQTPPTSADNGRGFVFVATDGVFDGRTGTGAGATGQETAYGLVPLSTFTQFPIDGAYTVWVHGRDSAGVWGDWTPVQFTVKRKAQITGLVVGRATGGGLTVTGTVDSPSPVTAVAAAGGYGTTPPTGTGASCPAPNAGGTGVTITCTLPAPAVAGGTYTVWVRVTNGLGTTAWTAVTVDTPAITSASINRSSATSWTVTMSGTSTQTFAGASTGVPLSAVAYAVGGATAPTGNGTACTSPLPAATSTTFTYSCTVSTTTAPTGDLRIWLRPTNVGTGSWVSVTATRPAPAVTLTQDVPTSATSYRFTAGVTVTSTQTFTGATTTVSPAALTSASYSLSATGANPQPCAPLPAASAQPVTVTCAVSAPRPATSPLNVWVQVSNGAMSSAWVPAQLANAVSSPAVLGTVSGTGSPQAVSLGASVPADLYTVFERLTLTPGTLVTGTGWATVATLADGSGTTVQVQYQRTSAATNATRSLRLAVNGTPGTGVVSWTTTTTTRTLNLAWVAGQQLTLSVTSVTGTSSVTAPGTAVASATVGGVGGTSGSATIGGTATTPVTVRRFF